MNSSLRSRLIAATAVALGLLGVASAAQARTDVHLSIGLMGGAPAYVQPAPVYVQPSPFYVQPQPVYVQPRTVYVQPSAPVYVQPGYSYSYEQERAWRRAEWERRSWRNHHHGHGRDRD
jgi:hypothetical protein